MTLVLEIPGRPLNMNDRMHPLAKAKATKMIRTDAYQRAYQQWGRPANARRHLTYPVRITVADICRTHNLRDTINAVPAIKAIIDGLTDYGLWPDDSPQYVGAIELLPAVKGTGDGLELTIRSADHQEVA